MIGFKRPVFPTQAARKRCGVQKGEKLMPQVGSLCHWLGLGADVEVGVDVGCAAEMPDH